MSSPGTHSIYHRSKGCLLKKSSPLFPRHEAHAHYNCLSSSSSSQQRQGARQQHFLPQLPYTVKAALKSRSSRSNKNLYILRKYLGRFWMRRKVLQVFCTVMGVVSLLLLLRIQHSLLCSTKTVSNFDWGMTDTRILPQSHHYNRQLTAVTSILLNSTQYSSMFAASTTSVRLPNGHMSLKASKRPNYGGLDHRRNQASVLEKQQIQQPHVHNVNVHDYTQYNDYRAYLLQQMDNTRDELNGMSDQERAILQDPGRYEHYDEIDYGSHPQKQQLHNLTHYDTGQCVRPKWSFGTNLNCNSMHEVGVSLSQLLLNPLIEEQSSSMPNLSRDDIINTYAVKYLSEGSFRMAWLLRELTTETTIVMKNLRMALDWNALTLKQVHLEALVMRQTLDSPATANIYGHCGTSILVETGQSIRNSIFYAQNPVAKSVVEGLQVEFGTKSLNRLTDEQRLKLALQMAESLAAMHGNVNGVIVNDDLQVFQWVVCQNGNVKLNDFNNAVILEWNENTQKYCSFTGNGFDSVYRSPQENSGELCDERADIHVLGSMYYNLLTGLMPFYQHESHKEAVAALIHRQETPYIDPAFRNGTMIQQTLVSIMVECWQYEPATRPSVFQILTNLRAAVTAYEKAHAGAKIAAVDLRPLGRPL